MSPNPSPEHARSPSAPARLGFALALGLGLILVGTEDAEVIATGVRLLVFVAVFQLFDAVAISYVNALRGAGDLRRDAAGRDPRYRPDQPARAAHHPAARRSRFCR